ncbi:putative manganese transporter [Vibrio sp. SCSIO 43133]|uniref:putative manganese transporter n=1 Tax=Vibrio sp. SCSIO 43133 TaxID=2802577 RepID=UPI0020761352|nr:putative manganese transporter [Vibrio sp. SCSIO 43133]USD99495.1 putative manganese transporter [Vibrio sp. SCSIO 43133]
MQQVKNLAIVNGLTIDQFTPKYKRLILPIAMAALLASSVTREVTINALSDAFWAVSCYVVFTLVVYHQISQLISSQNRLVELYHHSPTHQVVFSSLLGALPGCGGAIIVTTQFVSGRVGFGSVVAVLTATMGDAAFLILASKPSVGLGLVAMGVVVGMISGLIVNKIHAADFLRPKSANPSAKRVSQVNNTDNTDCTCKTTQESTGVQRAAINLQGLFWKWIIVPALIVAFAMSFQVDINQVLGLPTNSIEWTGAVLAVVMMFLWAFTKEINDYQSTVAEDAKIASSHPMQKAAQDTHFVSAWVIVAFLFFELSVHFAHIDLGSALSGYGIYMPLVGMLVGLLPGCGPQILVTSLYITGAMPMSAQISNAISNDGDALFPAIALAPKAALAATFYSAIPAIIVGYGYYWLFEL